jgi:hypothetical protein
MKTIGVISIVIAIVITPFAYRAYDQYDKKHTELKRQLDDAFRDVNECDYTYTVNLRYSAEKAAGECQMLMEIAKRRHKEWWDHAWIKGW